MPVNIHYLEMDIHRRRPTPLYVRDEKVNELAEQVRQILNVPTKTEAIRLALERVVEAGIHRPSRDEVVSRLREKYRLPRYEDLEPFDDKAFLDEMWGGEDVP